MQENDLVVIKDNEILLNDEFLEKYKSFKKLQLEMDLMEKDFKEQLKSAMEAVGTPLGLKKNVLKSMKHIQKILLYQVQSRLMLNND